MTTIAPLGTLKDGRFTWNTDGGFAAWSARRAYSGPVFASAPLPFNGRAMSVQDHDAQMAELEAEVERLNDDIFDLHQQIANLCE